MTDIRPDIWLGLLHTFLTEQGGRQENILLSAKVWTSTCCEGCVPSPGAKINMRSYLVQQISVKSGVSTALYDKSIKLGTLILDTMGSIFKIRGNRDMLRVSQERVVKVLGVIIQNGRRQRYFFSVERYSIIV